MGGKTQTPLVSIKLLWTGRIVSALPVLFLLLDGVMKLFKPAPVVEATTRLGYSEGLIVPLGLVLIVCTLIYAAPLTAVLGAILLTGYLGGAVATHVRAGDPLFPMVFPVLVGVLIWGGLLLRERRLWPLLPLRSKPSADNVAPVSKKLLWAGYIVTAFPVLMLLMSGASKLAKPDFVKEGFAHLGWDENLALGLGLLELACTIVYLIPRTTVLGAILLAGYFGGAIATHVRVGEAFVGAALLSILVWAGLYLREQRLWQLLPVRK
jgi:hypothetical protein